MKSNASIVIPLLNQVDAWLEKCILSALAQTVRCEVIVVTSKRTKRSNIELLQQLQNSNHQLRVIPRDQEHFAHAINTGIRASSADRIGLLFSDDWLETVAVASCLSQDADIVSTGISFYDATAKREFISLRRQPTSAEFCAKPTLEQKASYLEHFFLFTKSALLAVGGVDHRVGLTGADDYDMIWSMLEQGATVQIVTQSLYNCRDHDGERLTMREREAQIADLQKILAKHGVPPREREKLIEDKAKWYGETVHAVMSRIRDRRGSGQQSVT